MTQRSTSPASWQSLASERVVRNRRTLIGKGALAKCTFDVLQVSDNRIVTVFLINSLVPDSLAIVSADKATDATDVDGDAVATDSSVSGPSNIKLPLLSESAVLIDTI